MRLLCVAAALLLDADRLASSLGQHAKSRDGYGVEGAAGTYLAFRIERLEGRVQRAATLLSKLQGRIEYATRALTFQTYKTAEVASRAANDSALLTRDMEEVNATAQRVPALQTLLNSSLLGEITYLNKTLQGVYGNATGLLAQGPLAAELQALRGEVAVAVPRWDNATAQATALADEAEQWSPNATSGNATGNGSGLAARLSGLVKGALDDHLVQMTTGLAQSVGTLQAQLAAAEAKDAQDDADGDDGDDAAADSGADADAADDA